MIQEYTSDSFLESQAAFENAKRKIIGQERIRRGIGTLSEKTIHAVVKYYYEPNDDCHEIKCEGYVADIWNSTGIIEIQTRAFQKLRKKLDAFLQSYPVTVVYPMPYHKWLCWIDTESGEISKRRKSPKCWNAYDAFYELYKIKQYLQNPNLTIKLLFVDMEEYRELNGWSRDKKRGSTRYDRIPLELQKEITIECPRDYVMFVPFSLQEPFTSRDFSKAAKIDFKTAGLVLNILSFTGAVKRIGKKGNSILYTEGE